METKTINIKQLKPRNGVHYVTAKELGLRQAPETLIVECGSQGGEYHCPRVQNKDEDGWVYQADDTITVFVALPEGTPVLPATVADALRAYTIHSPRPMDEDDYHGYAGIDGEGFIAECDGYDVVLDVQDDGLVIVQVLHHELEEFRTWVLKEEA